MISARQFLYRFLTDPSALLGFVIFLALAILAVGAPWLAPQNPYDPLQIDIMDSMLPPNWIEDPMRLPGDMRFPLGTDEQGRGVLSTIMHGAGISLTIGLGAVVVQMTLGVMLGLLAGYRGGWADSLLMRIADIQLSLSTMMLAIIALALFREAFQNGLTLCEEQWFSLFGYSVDYGCGGKVFDSYNDIALYVLILVIGVAEWPRYARTVRANVMAERAKEYVDAARVAGVSNTRIMWRHILPNTMTPVFVIATIQVAEAIMTEAGLSFLGLGMPINQPSLGTLIKNGFDVLLSGQWWVTLFPAIVLILLVFSLNLLGDWLRDTLNPKLYRGR